MKATENMKSADKNHAGKNNQKTLAVFFIQPFIAFLLAISQLKSKYSFVVIFSFFVLFGFTFLAQNESFDSFRYIERFHQCIPYDLVQYQHDIADFFTFKSKIKDLYVITSYFIVSRFTDNYHVLMALWAAVFSFFCLKSFRFFVNCPEFEKSLAVFLLAFLFLSSNSIFNINGVRFWTAAWVAVYVVFEMIVNKNYKFTALALLTPLIHISYLFFVGVLIVFLLTRKFENIWMLLFFVSFFVSEISIQLFRNYQEHLPPFIQSVIWSYAAEENLAEHRRVIEQIPLYAKILNSLPRYFLNLMMFVFITNYKRMWLFKSGRVVFIFLLIWLSFVNFTMAIPSFGSRFIALSVPFVCYLGLLTYRHIPMLPKLIYLIPVVYSYSILYWCRAMISVTDPYLIISVFPHIVIKNLL
jgi:hypothetical protein